MLGNKGEISSNSDKKLVLVVDDEIGTVKLLQIMLHHSGYRTIAALDGKEAIKLAIQHIPDLILLDIVMPGMDGYEVMQHLRSHPTVKHIPILVLSAMSSQESVALGLRLGADDYITKPTTAQELTMRIGVLLRTRDIQISKFKPVFISYKRGDWDDFVKPLISRLETEGFPFWVDKSSIEGSHDWLDEINKALKSAERMIVCVSPESLESRYVKMEYRYAFNNGIRLYPLICRPADLPAELQVLHYYKFTELDALVAALKKP